MEAEWKDIKTYPSWYLLQRIYWVVKSKWFCWKGLICDHLFWWTASSSPIWYNIDIIGCVAGCLAAFRSHTQEEDWSTKRLPHSLEFMHTYQLFRKLMLWIRLVSCVDAMHVATRSYRAKEHCPQPHIETTLSACGFDIEFQIKYEMKIRLNLLFKQDICLCSTAPSRLQMNLIRSRFASLMPDNEFGFISLPAGGGQQPCHLQNLILIEPKVAA